MSVHSTWGSLHAQWPATIVADLNKRLPPQYIASPRVQLGTSFEIDVAASEQDEAPSLAEQRRLKGGAVAIWAPPQPTLAFATELPGQDVYEVQIYETEWRGLVAAIEIVSPANKDRFENRRAFAAKCATLLQQGVSVSIVDLVTTRWRNLYGEILELLDQTDPFLSPAAPPLYAAACRWRRHGPEGLLEAWTHVLAIGQPLPTLPLWLAADLAVPLDLETTYEETCRALRIP
jgi:hypothetical protein